MAQMTVQVVTPDGLKYDHHVSTSTVTKMVKLVSYDHDLDCAT